MCIRDRIELDYDVHLTAGSYYLCVERYSDGYAGNYDFRLDFTSAGESFPETAGGSNNSLASAETVSLGKDYKGQLALNDELDYYKFNMTSSGKVSLTGTVYMMKYVDLTIFDATGTKVWADDPYWNSTTQQIELDYDVHLTAGTYYLCVERYSDGYAGNYDFRLDFTSAGESFPETKDDNDNSLAAANQISLSKTYKGQMAEKMCIRDRLNIMLAWLGAITYTLQIYYDFSGYSDMAIGLGKVFGFQFKENFNYPYQSASIKEFWRRWHISLSTWFKEYLYIPLGGNRKGTIRTNINKLIVFFTTGLWHGANWTFVLWGMIHGLFSMLESSRYFPFTKRKWCGHIYTMAVVTTAFVLFRADDVQQGMHIIGQMYSGFHFEEQITALFLQQLDPLFLCVFAAGVIFSQPVKVWLENKVGERGWVRYLTLGLSLLLLLVCICNLSASTFNPFIYFRF